METRLLNQITQDMQDAVKVALERQFPPPNVSPFPRMSQETGKDYQDHQVPVNFGSEGPSGSKTSPQQVKQEERSESEASSTPTRSTPKGEPSVMEFDPYGTSTPAPQRRVGFQFDIPPPAPPAPLRPTPQPQTGPAPRANAMPTTAGPRFTPAPPQETDEEKEMRMFGNLAAIVGHAFAQPMEQVIRANSQTPAPSQPKSKIPAPEKFDGKKGNAAKAFLLDCKTYFIANPSSFPTDDSRIMYVLMNLKDGIPKQWGQHYLRKLLSGDPDTMLMDWEAFEAGFLANWSDPAALQVAERRIGELNQTGSASNYATEFRVIASKLDWSDSALMAAFRQGLKPFIKEKLIEHTIGRDIKTLDDLISLTCLIDNTLFEARRASKTIQGSSSSSPAPSGKNTGRSNGFVTLEIREKRKKAGECVKCGEKGHKFENCKNG